MSRPLSRIRSLVSEIEEIHRSGQQGNKPRPQPLPISETKAATPVTETIAVTTQVKAREVNSAKEETDIFAALNEVVHLGKPLGVAEVREEQDQQPPSKISMKLSGPVSLSLQIEDSGETVELKQIGNLLEIRFEDGKAFHLPLKAMA